MLHSLYVIVSVPLLITGMIFCKHIHMGGIVSVASFTYGFNLYFCFTDFMICFTDLCYFSVPLLVTVMMVCKYMYLHMGGIVSVASFTYGFNLYFCFTDYMICFTDLCYFSVPILVTVMMVCKYIYLHMGGIVSVASFTYGFNLYFCFTDFMICFTDLCYFSVPLLVTVMMVCKYMYLHMGRIVSVASSMYGFNPNFGFTDFMICFDDFMIVLSLFIG